MDDVFIKYSHIGEIFDYLSLGVIILSPDRKITSMNRTAEVLTGYKESEVIGIYCYRIFLDYLCGGSCKFLEAEETERKNVVSDIWTADQINEHLTITKIEAPIYGVNKELVGCIEVFQDYSAFKDLIKRIRYDDIRLKIILDNLDIGVLTLDRGNHISFFNTTAEKITGFSRSEVLGKPCHTVLGEDFCKDILALQQSMNKGNFHSSMEGKIVVRGGHAIPVRANYITLKNEEGGIVGGLATISDLSLKYQFDRAFKDRYTFGDMVGKAPVMQRIFEIIPIVAPTESTILIEGPTGTGKDLLTKVIHNSSTRHKKPLVKVNCAALPDNLLESEMFGYVKGAFTGANRDKPGRFQDADGGTIFLDEIGDLPLSLQAKLLRVLEDREFYPLGSRKTTKVDVRIISATNQRLEKLVQERRFREDLFYRLNVMRLELPALKERRSDIPFLISHILNRLCAARDTQIDKISEAAMEVLLNYDYPGNIRELENILEHALIICQGSVIERKHFPVSLLKAVDTITEERKPLAEKLGHEEKEKILSMLKKYEWKRSLTARALNINRSTLWRKMKKYDILC
ncbi:sigma-54 interaction domain-containing protein [Desulfonema magnum]|uniref:Sigma-54 interaction domain-containing protein, PAS domain-containing n=1 Tax=Desulfonema magnum TaxID=45655 RepID=A0A975BEM0_9BACT|nr:sigma 54-interacting transcriptional regulator [Desulfonema magnum]QTA84112.1 Sigma-54 interaction domain-containing protein, PAS domain-containing [Desulfonema magnum]